MFNDSKTIIYIRLVGINALPLFQFLELYYLSALLLPLGHRQSLCKTHFLKAANVCREAISQSVQTVFILRSITRGVFGRNGRKWPFYCTMFDISQSQHRIALVNKGWNKKSFAIRLFQFCDLKTQQRYVLRKEMKISTGFFGRPLALFSQAFDQASRCSQIS